MEVEEDDSTTYKGDDDSFEDSEGKPLHTFLYQYVGYKLNNGVVVTNNNGCVERKTVATIDELGLYYCTHPSLIKQKQDKYEAYNARKGRKLRRDYVYSASNDSHYTYYGERIDRYRRINQPGYVNPKFVNEVVKLPVFESKEERRDRIQEAIRTKRLRIEDVSTEKELYDYFDYHIKHQKPANKSIAHSVFSLKNGSDDEEIDSEQNANIKSILASGVSGTGKSAYINLIKPLFRMERGGENENCFAELRFANVSDSSHRNAINGPGAGFEGATEPCLVDHLERARIAIEERGPSHVGQPNVIIVFIDELCKPKKEVRVLDSLNSLFADGILQRASGNVTFKLPDNTKLLFYSTANYGESKIVKYDAKKDHGNAVIAIKQDMRRKMVRECDISRIGEIVPFFPMSIAQTKEIMRLNIDRYFSDTKRSFSMLEQDRECFIDYYFAGNYTKSHGVRAPNKKIKQELQHLRILQHHSGAPHSTETILRFNVVPYRDEYTKADDIYANHPELARALTYDEMNEDNINECIEVKSDIGIASLCKQEEGDIPTVVYVSRPQSFTIDEEEEVEEEMEVDNVLGSSEKERQIRLLLSMPRYRENELTYLIYEILDGPGKRPARGDNTPANTRKKRKTDESSSSSDNQSNNSSVIEMEDMTGERIECPKCRHFKCQKSFIKKYTSKAGIQKQTKCDLCGTCRKGEKKIETK